MPEKEKLGVEEIMDYPKAIEQLAELVGEAKGEDGVITLTDAFRPAVWSEAGDVVSAGYEAVKGSEMIWEEMKDLNTDELTAVLKAFVTSTTKLVTAIAK